MLGRITFLFLLIVFLFVAALMTVPIKVLSEQLAVQLPPDTISLNGSLSKGNGRVQLSNPKLASLSPLTVYWQWCPGSGLSAWCIDAKSLAMDIRIEGVLTIWPGHITLSQAKLSANVTDARLSQGIFNGSISTRIQGNIVYASVAYDDFFPRDVDANLALGNLNIGSIKLGNYRTVLRSNEQSVLSVRVQGRGKDVKNLSAKALLTPLAKLPFGKAASKEPRIGWQYNLNANSDNLLLKGILAIKGKRLSSGGYVMDDEGKW